MQGTQKSPYSIIKSRYETEKSQVLLGLKDSSSNKCVAGCETPKYVFLVDPSANKQEIRTAIEEIYKEKKVKVRSVNTLNVKPKKRRVRGCRGKTAAFKKAVVTFEPGDELDNV